MTEKIGNHDPLNVDTFIGEFNDLDETARAEKLKGFAEKFNSSVENGRQLYARTKKAEGFEQDEDGSWIKKVEVKKKESAKPDEEVYKRLDNMALKFAGIEAADELELFTKWKDRTKMEADEVIGEKIFQAQLADIRQAKANAAATDIKGGDGKDTGEKGTPEYWIGKATKDSSGELLFPDDLPNDSKLRSDIFEKLAAQAKGQDKRFYNQ